MKTNMEMLDELYRTFTPETKHVVSIKEIHLINRVLELDDRDILDLRNLRDMTVMYFNMLMSSANSKDAFELVDKMSAVTSVIDLKISNVGGEV